MVVVVAGAEVVGAAKLEADCFQDHSPCSHCHHSAGVYSLDLRGALYSLSCNRLAAFPGALLNCLAKKMYSVCRMDRHHSRPGNSTLHLLLGIFWRPVVGILIYLEE